MRILRGVGRFLVDFVVGDDWRIAVGVVAALSIGWVAVVVGIPAPAGVVLTGLLVGAGFTVTMLREGRRPRRR